MSEEIIAPRKSPEHWGGSTPVDKMDQTPLELPVDAHLPESIESMVARMVHQHVADREQAAAPKETWDEANDFEPDEDEGLPDFSAYTLTDVEPEALQGYEVSESSLPPQSEPNEPSEASQEASDPTNNHPVTPKPQDSGPPGEGQAS